MTFPLSLFLATALAGAPQRPPTAQTPSSGDTAEPPSAPASTLPPDPDLLRTNRLLRQQAHRGDRWLIGGRVGLGLAAVPVLLGVTALGLNAAEKDRPDANLRNLGVGAIAVGSAGMVASAVFMGLGFAKIRRARVGQLTLRAAPGFASLGYTRRF